jgi:putative endonuclease
MSSIADISLRQAISGQDNLTNRPSSFTRKTPLRSSGADIGRQGEAIARAHLLSLGYEVLGRNIRIGRDEVDLLARDPEDGTLVFVEVKARRSVHEDYRPELNMTHRKRRAMSRAARAYVAREEYEGGYRMDLICVAAGLVIDHVKELEWEDGE